MKQQLEQKLRFIIELDKMKSIYRRTILIDRSRRETDAEHSWHAATAAMVLYDEAAMAGTDLGRIIRMLLVHDLVEIYAGDTFAFDTQGYTDKQAREQAAADKLFSMLEPSQGGEYRALWEEFDAMQTPDALYASAIDRLQPFLSNVMTEGHTWDHGKVCKAQVMRRLQPVLQVFPALSEYIETAVASAIEAGWLAP